MDQSRQSTPDHARRELYACRHGTTSARDAIDHAVQAPGFYFGSLTDASDGRAFTNIEQYERLQSLLGDMTHNTPAFRDALARIVLSPKFAGVLSANDFRALEWFLHSYDNQHLILVAY